MTVWHHRAEDRAGSAGYRTRIGTAYLARNAAESGERYGGAEEKISGFLLPAHGQGVDAELPFFLVPDRDYVAPGAYAAYASPTEAMEAGAPVFRVTASVQPPHISDGTLVDWCCFEGVRTIP